MADDGSSRIEHVGLHRQHAGHGGAAALAGRELVRRAIGLVLQSDARERRVDALAQRIAAQAQVGGAEGDVGAHAGHEELVVGVLEDDPDAAADLGARARAELQAADA